MNDTSHFALKKNELEPIKSIGNLFGLLLIHRFLILGVTIFCCLLGTLVWLSDSKTVTVNGILQIKGPEESNLGLSALDAISSWREENPSITAEIEIMSSREILGRVVHQKNFDIVTEPVHLPLIGQLLVKHLKVEVEKKAPFGLSNYAWGGEEITVKHLEVSNRYFDKPVLLTVISDKHFLLADSETNEKLGSGSVGKKSILRTEDGSWLEILVSNISASNGSRFLVTKLNRLSSIKRLKGMLTISQVGKGSGIIEILIEGKDPLVLTQIVDELMEIYLSSTAELRSQVAGKTLDFLDLQLPLIRDRLESSEALYNSYRLQEGSVDLTTETQSILDSVVEIDRQILNLSRERGSVRQRFKPLHPKVKDLDTQINLLKERKDQLNLSVARLPSTQQNVLRLRRDVELTTRLYRDLLDTAQELKLAQAGAVGNARIIDSAAYVGTKELPRLPIVIAISLTLGFAISSFLIFIKISLRDNLFTPDGIESALGYKVLAAIPNNKNHEKANGQKESVEPSNILALDDDKWRDLNSLKNMTSYLHGNRTGQSTCILVTGARRKVGCTLVAENTAVIIARQNKRVVLIDADTGQGRLKQKLEITDGPGLTDYLDSNNSIVDIVRRTKIENLYLIHSGIRSISLREVFKEARLEELLSALKNKCEYIIIDAPCAKYVPETATIMKYCSHTIVVAQSNRHTSEELVGLNSIMTEENRNLTGYVLNRYDKLSAKFLSSYRAFRVE